MYYTPNEVVNSGKDYQWMLKPLGDRLLFIGYSHDVQVSLHRILTAYKGKKVLYNGDT